MAPSSPRLPSPPPAPEIQMAPGEQPSGAPNTRAARTSPGAGSAEAERRLVELNSRRRIHPGTKAADMAAGPPLVPLPDNHIAFDLQEHLAALHYDRTEQGKRPLSRAAALQIANAPPHTPGQLWLYELCHFLIRECNRLIVDFLTDTPPCSAATCPEMRASEWQFLCAVHEQPKSCCAIDYCCHTLDWAANVVTDPALFPAGLPAAASDAGGPIDQAAIGNSYRSLVNIFRRLHRIFAHAWFQHRAVFWALESHTGLYLFFKVVCDIYHLLPGENYKLPPEAEGLEPSLPLQSPDDGVGAGESGVRTPAPAPPTRPDPNHSSLANNHVGRSNTRRHIKSSPSTGSSVTTVVETDEDECPDPSRNAHTQVLLLAPAPTPAPVPISAPTLSSSSETSSQDVKEEAKHPDVVAETAEQTVDLPLIVDTGPLTEVTGEPPAAEVIEPSPQVPEGPTDQTAQDAHRGDLSASPPADEDKHDSAPDVEAPESLVTSGQSEAEAVVTVDQSDAISEGPDPVAAVSTSAPSPPPPGPAQDLAATKVRDFALEHAAPAATVPSPEETHASEPDQPAPLPVVVETSEEVGTSQAEGPEQPPSHGPDSAQKVEDEG